MLPTSHAGASNHRRTANNYVRVARIACAERGVPYTLIPVMPHTPAVDAVHPFGKIPVICHGDVTLSEARAICFYIDHAFDGPPLVPRHPVDGRVDLARQRDNRPLAGAPVSRRLFLPADTRRPSRSCGHRRCAAEYGTAFLGARPRRRQESPRQVIWSAAPSPSPT